MITDKNTYIEKMDESKVRGEEQISIVTICTDSTDNLIAGVNAAWIVLKPRKHYLFVIAGFIKKSYFLFGLDDIITFELKDQEKILNIDVQENDQIINMKFSAANIDYKDIEKVKILWLGSGRDSDTHIYNSEKLLESSVVMRGTHVNGLPIAEGMDCVISASDSKYVFEYDNKEFSLSMNKVTDVGIKTDIQIQKSVSSNTGNAIAGGILFGAAGAIIGGSSKEHTSKIETKFLVFSYKSDVDQKYICFQIEDAIRAQKLVEKFKQLPRETIVVEL